MPIVQSRILALIIAANDYRQAWETTERAISRAIHELQAKQIDPAEVLDLLLYNCHASLKDASNSKATLVIESKLIARNYKDNEARKLRAQRRRTRLGLPEPGPSKLAEPTLEHLQAFERNKPSQPFGGTAQPADNPILMNSKFDQDFAAAEAYYQECLEAERLGLPQPKPKIPLHLQQPTDLEADNEELEFKGVTGG